MVKRPVESIQVASDILNTAVDQLHATAKKIRGLFEAELRYVVETGGKIGMRLFALMKVVAHLWVCDTQGNCFCQTYLPTYLPTYLHTYLPTYLPTYQLLLLGY